MCSAPRLDRIRGAGRHSRATTRLLEPSAPCTVLKRSKTELATLGMGTGSALGRECVEQPGLSRFASDIENPLLVVPGATLTRWRSGRQHCYVA